MKFSLWTQSWTVKTIEIIDTDAEGRMLLGDALHYAKKYNHELFNNNV